MNFFYSSNILIEYPLSKALNIFSDHHATGVEIWVEHLWEEEVSLQSIRELLHSLGLKRTLHAPTRDINLVSTNPGIRKESLKQTLEALEIAYSLGVGVVTIHPGHRSSSKDRSDSCFHAQLNAFEKIGKKAQELGIFIGVEVMENKPEELIVEPHEMNLFLDTLDLDCVGATLDIAHAATSWKGQITTNTLLERIIGYMKSLKRIRNVHLSNFDSNHVHLPLARGTFDLYPILSELNRLYTGAIVVEGFIRDEGMVVLSENQHVIEQWQQKKSRMYSPKFLTGRNFECSKSSSSNP